MIFTQSRALTARVRLRVLLSAAKGPQIQLLSCGYATHRDTPSSLLSQQLERAAKNDRTGSSGGRDSVGPFPLGVQPLNLRTEKADLRKWSELTPGGKVMRTTARASNFTVILVGASLSAVLAYALATELFARNSPTRLYSDACDRVKASPAVLAYLPPPLSFHTNAPSPLPPRHRQRHPQSHSAVDSNGVEHLLLHFWITSSHAKNIHHANETSWSDWFDRDWDWDRIRLEESYAYAKSKAFETWAKAKQNLAFISGAPPHTSTDLPDSFRRDLPTTTRNEKVEEERKGWSFLGMFKDIRIGGKGKARDTSAGQDYGLQWESGEVHVDFVKDENGIFQYRYLLVDVPNSRVSRPIRVTVERGDGYSERDGMFLWQ